MPSPALGAPVLQHILEQGLALGGCQAFVDALRAETGVNSRLILVGSIFGGTGACGIPAVHAVSDGQDARHRHGWQPADLRRAAAALLPFC